MHIHSKARKCMRLLITHTFHYFISLMLNISFSVSLFSITLFFRFAYTYTVDQIVHSLTERNHLNKSSLLPLHHNIFMPLPFNEKSGSNKLVLYESHFKAYNASLLQLKHSNILTLGSIRGFFSAIFYKSEKHTGFQTP